MLSTDTDLRNPPNQRFELNYLKKNEVLTHGIHVPKLLGLSSFYALHKAKHAFVLFIECTRAKLWFSFVHVNGLTISNEVITFTVCRSLKIYGHVGCGHFRIMHSRSALPHYSTRK